MKILMLCCIDGDLWMVKWWINGDMLGGFGEYLLFLFLCIVGLSRLIVGVWMDDGVC